MATTSNTSKYFEKRQWKYTHWESNCIHDLREDIHDQAVEPKLLISELIRFIWEKHKLFRGKIRNILPSWIEHIFNNNENLSMYCATKSNFAIFLSKIIRHECSTSISIQLTFEIKPRFRCPRPAPKIVMLSGDSDDHQFLTSNISVFCHNLFVLSILSSQTIIKFQPTIPDLNVWWNIWVTLQCHFMHLAKSYRRGSLERYLEFSLPFSKSNRVSTLHLNLAILPRHLLWSLYFLKTYPIENVASSFWGYSQKACR